MAISAAQANQVAIEEQFTPDGPRHGRLSYTVSEIFEACDRPISYRELAQRILWHYTKKGWTYRSTPAIEGTDLERAVLGAETWPRRRAAPADQFRGAAHCHGRDVSPGYAGEHSGSVPGPRQRGPRTALGLRRGDKRRDPSRRSSSRSSSRVAPRSRPCPSWPAVSWRFAIWAICGLRSTLPPKGRKTLTRRPAGRPRSSIGFGPLAEEGDSPIRLREEPSRRPSGSWWPVPAAFSFSGPGVRVRSSDREGKWLGEILGPRPLDNDLTWWLGQSLRRIARATNLMALADEAAANEDPEIDVELAVSRNGTPFAPAGPDQAEVRANEVLEISIGNRGSEAVSVAVFYVDSAFGITPFFPKSSRDSLNNEIVAGGELFRPVRFRIDDHTLGWEHVLVVAVTAKQKTVIDDLLLLQQPGCVPGPRGDRRVRVEPHGHAAGPADCQGHPRGPPARNSSPRALRSRLTPSAA